MGSLAKARSCNRSTNQIRNFIRNVRYVIKKYDVLMFQSLNDVIDLLTKGKIINITRVRNVFYHPKGCCLGPAPIALYNKNNFGYLWNEQTDKLYLKKKFIFIRLKIKQFKELIKTFFVLL